MHVDNQGDIIIGDIIIWFLLTGICLEKCIPATAFL